MLNRCASSDPKKKRYYGSVSVSPEWESFDAFKKWADNNAYVDGLTIDRIDPLGDYTPENCRWATKKIQSDNRKVACSVTINGETKSVIEWHRETGIQFSTLYKRYKKGVAGGAFIAAPLQSKSHKEASPAPTPDQP